MPQPKPPGPPVPPPPTAPHASRPRVVKVGRVRTALAGTPGKLRVAGAVGVVSGLVFAFGAFGAVVARSGGINGADNHAAQLVRLQAIRSNLTRADAAATNAFLVGGLEPADTRASYDDGIARATAAIAAASSSSKSDAATLEKINQDVSHYVGLVESARANNRQGFPIGAAYLRQAGNSLRAEVLPPLLKLVTSEEKRISDDYGTISSADAALIAVLVLAIVALLAVQVWLSIKTRRTFNTNLALATALVVVAGLIGATAMAFAQQKASDVRSGSLSETILLSTARADVFDAKSAESLTLINRGSGQPFEAQYQSDFGHASALFGQIDHLGNTDEGRSASTSGLGQLLDTYDTAHQAVRKQDDDGDWDAAVRLATSDDARGTKVAFAQFDARSNSRLASEATHVSDDLHTARSPLGAIAVLVLLAGFVAAALAWRGIAARLREYR